MRTANHEDIGNDWPETTILPEQFLGGSPEGSPLRGVKGLLVAILEDAIACLDAGRSQSAKARMAAVEAARWVRSSDTSYPFAFESICDVLSIDVGRLRARLLEIAAEAGERKRAPSARRVEANLSKIPAPRVRHSRRSMPARGEAPAQQVA